MRDLGLNVDSLFSLQANFRDQARDFSNWFATEWLKQSPPVQKTHALLYICMRETYGFLKLAESHNEVKEREQLMMKFFSDNQMNSVNYHNGIEKVLKNFLGRACKRVEEEAGLLKDQIETTFECAETVEQVVKFLGEETHFYSNNSNLVKDQASNIVEQAKRMAQGLQN